MNETLCIYPWTTFYIHPETFGCCCRAELNAPSAFSSYPIGFNYKLWDLWNSEYSQNHRKLMIKKGISCACYPKETPFNCIPSKETPQFLDFLTEDQILNNQKAEQNFIDGKLIVDNYPVYIELALDYFCNSRCIMCPQSKKFNSGKHSPPFIIFDQIKDEFSIFLKYAQKVNLIGGEPTISPNYNKLINATRVAGGAKISLVTNGYLLSSCVVPNLDVINWIYVSIDAARKDSYESIRRGLSWDRLNKELKNLIKVKGNIYLELGFVVQNQNYKEMVDFINFADDLGVKNISFDEVIKFEELSDNLFFNTEENKQDLKIEVEKAKKRAKDLNIKTGFLLPSVQQCEVNYV